MAGERSSTVRPLVDDLRRIFGNRLEAVVVYGWQQAAAAPTLVLVRSLSLDDLNACAVRTPVWHRAGVATPLLQTRADFARSLDAFPIEYGEILAQHEVVLGADPFDGMTIAAEDLRQACEVQVKSHLLHLREDYLETAGQHAEIDLLVRDSAPGFAALLRHLARLDGHAADTPTDLVAYAERRLRLDARTTGDVIALAGPDTTASVDAVRLFPAYLEAMEGLAAFVDEWRAA